MRRSNSSAFSLIEVAVAIAIVAILAGAVAPLAIKALNQQREQKTRDNLKIAYEALYGARDRRISNMAADFGYMQNPAPLTWFDLRFMTTSTATNGYGVVPQLYGPGAIFSWGWNGPYWTGSTIPLAATNGIPVDGWGRAIRLYNGPQIVSAGIDGAYTTADDLVYPTVVGLPGTTLVVNMIRQNPNGPPPPALPAGVSITIVHRAAGSTPNLLSTTPPPVAVWMPTWLTSNYTQTHTWNPNPGPVSITITTPLVGTSQQIVDLLPGQTQTIDFKFYD